MSTTREVAINRRIYSPTRLNHRHDYLQIVLPERGRLEMTVEGEPGVVTASHFVVVAPEQEHICWAPIPTQCFVVDMPSSGETHTADRLAIPFRSLDTRLATISQAIARELESGSALDPLVAEGIAAYLHAALTVQSRTSDLGTCRDHQARLAVRARDYIESRSADDLTISDIADEVGASASHIQRCFRAKFGLSIVKYIHLTRLRNSTNLLRTSDLTITEVATTVGFADSGYFARLFRREYGVSPGVFRTAK